MKNLVPAKNLLFDSPPLFNGSDENQHPARRHHLATTIPPERRRSRLCIYGRLKGYVAL
jgi:hypothetical protein